MVIYDETHHVIVERLLSGIDITSVDAGRDDDYGGIADRYIVDRDGNQHAVGMKCRGANSRNECPLTAWSALRGDLPEFANAGGKLYMLQWRDRHALIQLDNQTRLNTLLPPRWMALSGEELSRGITWKWMNRFSGVRLESRASRIQQGCVYVPAEFFTVLVEWSLEGELITRLDETV